MLILRCVATITLAVAESGRPARREAFARDYGTRTLTHSTVILVTVELVGVEALTRASVTLNRLHADPFASLLFRSGKSLSRPQVRVNHHSALGSGQEIFTSSSESNEKDSCL